MTNVLTPPVMDSTTLHEAVDLVIAQIERGWIRGHYSKDGCMCLGGAILYRVPAQLRNKKHVSARTAVYNEVRARTKGWSIPYWNDYIAKDKEEIIDLLNQIKKETKNETFKRERPVVN